MWHAIGKNDRLAKEIDYLQQKEPFKIAYFGGHESELPDFGRPWTVPSRYPNLTRYPVFLSIPDLIQFWKSSGSRQPKTLGISRYFGETRSFGYYSIFWVSPVRGEQDHHQVLFSETGTHKKEPRVQKKSAKSAILTSSMTVELLLVALRWSKTLINSWTYLSQFGFVSIFSALNKC